MMDQKVAGSNPTERAETESDETEGPNRHGGPEARRGTHKARGAERPGGAGHRKQGRGGEGA
jgi:hypothetical protein